MTGSKWKETHTVHQAITRLKHQEVVGMVQYGRVLTISEVTSDEEYGYKIKAVSQGQQGKLTMWEAVSDGVLTWADLWRMPHTRLSFLIRATYDTLPSPQNLKLWFGVEESCQLCGHQNPSLQHVLSSCKTALTQGHYVWRHDQILHMLAEVIEARRLEVNRASLATFHGLIQFVRQGGEALSSTNKQWYLLSPTGN